MNRSAIAALAILGASSAIAGDIPRYDPPRWRDNVASAGGARLEMIYQGCIHQEQEAYDSLKEQWTNLPAKMQAWCNQVARSGSPGSYMILSGCIKQEMDAKQKNDSAEPFHF